MSIKARSQKSGNAAASLVGCHDIGLAVGLQDGEFNLLDHSLTILNDSLMGLVDTDSQLLGRSLGCNQSFGFLSDSTIVGFAVRKNAAGEEQAAWLLGVVDDVELGVVELSLVSIKAVLSDQSEVLGVVGCVVHCSSVLGTNECF